jgi:acyl-CoA thioesterase I
VRARVPLVLGFLLLVACGRAPTVTPLPSPLPSATPPPTLHPVAGVVFYDENGNGMPDPGEDVRLPHVLVTLGGRSAESDAEGAFLVTDVPAGTRAVTLGAASLPPFYRPGRLPSVAVPLADGARVPVPVVLPIGANRPNVYLAFGDSITSGDGSRGNRGYRASLESQLRDYWGRAEIVNDGLESTRSDEGAARMGASLASAAPAYALILYGTNDWNLSACHRAITCFTVVNVQSMIRQAKAAGTLPVMSTIIPANPAYVDRLAEQRNGWIDETNALLVPMARAEGAVVADLHAAMLAASDDLPTLFTDHVHPDDRGYAAMADEFFRALTEPVGAAGMTARSAAATAAQGVVGRPAAAGPSAAGSSGKRQRPR